MKKTELRQMIKEEILKEIGDFYGSTGEKAIKDAIEQVENETRKTLKIPHQVVKDIKWMKKLGYTKGGLRDTLLHYYNSLGDNKYKVNTGNVVFDKLRGDKLYSLFQGAYNALLLESDYIASKIIAHLIDKKNNDEEIEDSYSETKEYFKSFGKDHKSNRVFDWSEKKVREWMKINIK